MSARLLGFVGPGRVVAKLPAESLDEGAHELRIPAVAPTPQPNVPFAAVPARRRRHARDPVRTSGRPSPDRTPSCGGGGPRDVLRGSGALDPRSLIRAGGSAAFHDCIVAKINYTTAIRGLDGLPRRSRPHRCRGAVLLAGPRKAWRVARWIRLMSRKAYPWGKRDPRTQLKAACERLRRALEAANERGYADIGQRLEAVVQSAKPLATALRYVAEAGLQPRTGNARQDRRVPGADLYQALQAIDASVLGLAQASVGSVSEGYAAFAKAANDLIASAEQAIERGVQKQLTDDTEAAWKRFGA